MAAIHNLSDNLQGILVELSEKIEKVEEKNNELEERTKELETKEVDAKAKIEEMVLENTALQERVTVLEQQMNVEAESKLKDLLEARQDATDKRVTAAEEKVLDHDKLVDRLESCEKKLASFYGEDTNILGRVGYLETRFKDFKKNEDAKLEQQLDGLNVCQTQNEHLRDRVGSLEEGLGVAQRLTDILHETKLDRGEVEPLLSRFKTDNRLVDEDTLRSVADEANTCKEGIADLFQHQRDKEEQGGAELDKIREDIETLQQNTEPAHKYECFGSDQAVKIFQIESKLKELEGMSTASIDGRLQAMDGQISATTSQMDRVLNIESFLNNNFDRIGTDYVHLSRLISDINEEISGHDHKMQDFEKELSRGGGGMQQQVATRATPAAGTDDAIAKLAKELADIEQLINSADYRMSTFAAECKDSFADMQANNDKKIDILAVWVSKNINLLASSTRKKFKQLLAGDDLALLSGHNNRAGHCLSCNQTKRPTSGSHPKSRVTEGKSPIFKITHLDQPHADDNNYDSHHNHTTHDASLMSDGTDGGGASFKMTVPSSLRMKVSNFRQNENDERLADDSVMDSAAHEENEDQRRDRSTPTPARPSSANSLPRKFFRNHNNHS